MLISMMLSSRGGAAVSSSFLTTTTTTKIQRQLVKSSFSSSQSLINRSFCSLLSSSSSLSSLWCAHQKKDYELLTANNNSTTITQSPSLLLDITNNNKNINATQIRSVHSKRQIKRLFKNNPARQRIEERIGVDRTPKPLEPPKYKPIIQNPIVLKNGWSPLPSPEIQVPTYPFHIGRTGNKANNATGFLPVYSNFSHRGKKRTTRIKKVTGDRDAFIKELRSVFNMPPPKNGNPEDDVIRIRNGGTIEINGLHVRPIKTWLTKLGF